MVGNREWVDELGEQEWYNERRFRKEEKIIHLHEAQYYMEP